MHEEISLTEAGMLIGLDSTAARRHMMRGDFGPARRDTRQWYVSRAHVELFRQRAKQATGSPFEADSVVDKA